MSVIPLPKIDLHLDLAGAAPPAFIRGLAREKHIDISGIFDARGAYAFTGAGALRKVREAARAPLQSPEDYHRLVHAALEQSAANGVIYSEIFLSPDHCGGGDPGAWRDHLHAIREAAAMVERREGFVSRGIATCLRASGPQQARQAALCAAETAGDWLTGFALTGEESPAAPKDFAWAFDAAREAGLRLTASVGAEGGPQAVRDVLRDLRVERIGQGARIIEDPALAEDLAERGTVLVLCPGGDIALGQYPGWRSHPIGALYQRGAKVTVSSGAPAFFRVSMARVYERLHDAFDWDEAVFRDLAATAARAAFCDPAARDKIMKRLEQD